MATVFLLGPSVHVSATPGRPAPDYLALRRLIATTLGAHRSLIMEDQPMEPLETTEQKFLRLVRSQNVSDILVLWPPDAEMGATVDERLLLLTHRATLPKLPIWVFHHVSVMEIRGDELVILQPGSKSGYLRDATRLPLRTVPWTTSDDLLRLVRELGENVLAP